VTTEFVFNPKDGEHLAALELAIERYQADHGPLPMTGFDPYEAWRLVAEYQVGARRTLDLL
jgi:hypothetical protein